MTQPVIAAGASRAQYTAAFATSSLRFTRPNGCCARIAGPSGPSRWLVAISVSTQPGATQFLDHYAELLRVVLPGYEREGKRFVTLAVGCTGGKHRSVAIAGELAARAAALSATAGPAPEGEADVQVVHRDLGRE